MMVPTGRTIVHLEFRRARTASQDKWALVAGSALVWGDKSFLIYSLIRIHASTMPGLRQRVMTVQTAGAAKEKMRASRE